MGGGISCLAYIIVLRYLPQMKCWSGGRRIYSPSKNPKTRHHCNIPIYSNVCKPSLFLTREIYSCQMCIVTMWAAGLWPSHENKKHFGYVVHWEVLQVDFAIQLRWSEEHWGGGWDSNRSLQWTADGKHEGGATKATFHPPDMLQLYHGEPSKVSCMYTIFIVQVVIKLWCKYLPHSVSNHTVALNCVSSDAPCRYSSRALLITFSNPSVGPTSEEESQAFSSLGAVMKAASSAVGWVISLGKDFSQQGVQEISNRISPIVRSQLPGVDPRLCTGYATLLYFAEKVRLPCWISTVDW